MELLKKHTPFVPHWEKRPCRNDELDTTPGVSLQADFPDSEQLLETAYADFNRFLNEAGLAGTALEATVRHTPGLENEAYRLTIGPDSIQLDFTLAEALDIQFRSGHNILRFYSLRNALFDTPPDAPLLLKEMKCIVHEEIANSLRLAKICRQDARLGYHSEAEVYKYFPDKLHWRANQLKALLESDFADAECLQENLPALKAYLLGEPPSARPGYSYGSNGIRWSFDFDAESITFHLRFISENDNPESAYLFFMDEKGEIPPMEPIKLNRKEHPQTTTGWQADYTLSRLLLNQASRFWFGVEKVEYRPDNHKLHTNDKPGQFIHEYRLNLGYFGPDKLTLLCCNTQG